MNNAHFYYAPSEAHIRQAAVSGIPNVVVDSRGHGGDAIPGLRDDQLCLLPGYAAIYRKRKPHARAVHKAAETVNNRIHLARSLGLKAFIHSYELSFPLEIREAYPRLFVKQTSEARKADPACAKDRYLCLANERLRAMVTDKIAEVLSRFPDLSGYVYSFHESQLTTFAHVCDQCKNLPRESMLRWLYEAVRAGADQVNQSLVVIPRLWGVTHPKELGYENACEMVKVFDHDPSFWQTRRLPVLKRYRFIPEKVNPKLPAMLRSGDMLMYKATWGDYSLFQPLNKWAASYGDTPQIVELSFEHCVLGRKIPLIISAQHQEMIRRLQGKPIQFALVPVNWGRAYDRELPEHIGARPADWGLNFLNLELLPLLMQNPGLNLVSAAQKLIEARYGFSPSQRLIRRLFEATKILDGIVNVRGVSTVMNLNCMLRAESYRFPHVFQQMLWYRSMRTDGKRRTCPGEQNMRRICQEKDLALRQLERWFESTCRDISVLPCGMLKEDFMEFVNTFHVMGNYLAVSRKRIWIEYKFQEEKTASFPWMRELDKLLEKEKQLVAASSVLQSVHDDSLWAFFCAPRA
jgi:hypothetical protein